MVFKPVIGRFQIVESICQEMQQVYLSRCARYHLIRTCYKLSQACKTGLMVCFGCKQRQRSKQNNYLITQDKSKATFGHVSAAIYSFLLMSKKNLKVYWFKFRIMQNARNNRETNFGHLDCQNFKNLKLHIAYYSYTTHNLLFDTH